MHFWTIIEFKNKSLTPEALELMGKESKSDREDGILFYYAISLSKEDRELYLTSFQDYCSPNWNGEYTIEWYKKLQDVDFPILQMDGTIYRMDNALHGAINDRLWAERKKFVVTEDSVRMTIRDQHGNYYDLLGYTVEDVFRMYADKNTGYRKYRRQMFSEWEIVDENARERFEEWKYTAKGLKSDWDKFYGSGIVD